MKQLFVNNKATTMFFDSKYSNEDIAKWIDSRIHDGDNVFNLNEDWSARADYMIDGSIHIVGSEDFKEIVIEEVALIDIDELL